MKNLMRFAMVLALAGSALLYSGCTKDYQKDIDDLNTGVTTLQGTVQKLQEQVSALEALKSQIASLQGDVAPLQAAINKNTEAIAKLQDAGYVTKDELDAELNSIREETLDALADVAIVVGGNTEAIAELRKAYEAADAFTEALNLGKIASVALVRNYDADAPTNYVALNAWKLIGSDNSELYSTAALLNLDYQVSPASLAGTLSSDNVTLSIYSPKKQDYIEVPVTITEIDEEAGVVSLFANLFSPANKANFNVFGASDTDYYTPFALVINDESEDGIVNDIKSQYDFAEVVKTTTATNSLKYYADFKNIEVPYDKFASSERKLFDGLEFCLMIENDETDLMKLEEAAALFGVDVEALTPTLAKALTSPTWTYTGGADDKYIAFDAANWTAKMKATTLDAAKEALTNEATFTATASASIKVNGITKKVWDDSQEYSVVNAEGSSIIMTPDEVIPWIGTNTVAGTEALNFTTTKRIANNASFYVYRTYTDGANKKINVLKVEADGTKVNVTPQTASPSDFTYPTGYSENDFAAVPYSTAASDLEFVGTYTEDKTDYDVTLTLKLGAKPADKKNLDLGTFKVDGSYTMKAVVDLGGILKKFIGDDEDLYADVDIDETKANPLYYKFAETLTSVSTQLIATSAIKETESESTEITNGGTPDLNDFNFDFDVAQSDPDKGADKSTLTLPAPTEAGEAYIVTFNFQAFGVTYAGKLRVEVGSTANFALKARALVNNGVINVRNLYSASAIQKTVDGSQTGTMSLANIDFTECFELNKELTNEDPAGLSLKVVIELTPDKYTKPDGGTMNYTGTVTPNTSLKIDVDKTDGSTPYYKTTLKRSSESTLNWNDYTGEQISGKAILYRDWNEATTTGTAVNEIKFKIVAEKPVKTFDVTKLSVARGSFDINLDKALKMTSVLDGEPLSKNGATKIDEEKNPTTGLITTPAQAFSYSFESHKVSNKTLGIVDKDGKFTSLKDVKTLNVKINGQEETLIKDTHFTYDVDEPFTITLTTNNAYAVNGCTMTLKLGLKFYNFIDYSSSTATDKPQFADPDFVKDITIEIE